MSLVYNNKKLIGKCSKFSIEKVQGTSPFVMLENFDPKQPQFNENQQVVLDWAKSYLSEAQNIMWFIEELAFLSTTGGKMRYKQVAYTYESLSDKERRELLSSVMAWAQKQVAE